MSRGDTQPQTLGPFSVMPGGWQCPVGHNEPFGGHRICAEQSCWQGPAAGAPRSQLCHRQGPAVPALPSWGRGPY